MKEERKWVESGMVGLRIEIKGSCRCDESEQREMRVFFYRGELPKKSKHRVECRDIGVESHWLKEVRFSASRGLLSRG